MAEVFANQEDVQTPRGFTLDFKRVLSRAIRFWYVVVFFLGGSLLIAFYQTRYSQRVYPVSSSIIIREMQEISGAEFVFNNALANPYRNYLNEPYILKSFPLMKKVVLDLNFHISFYREGYFLTTEAYSYVPVRADWCGGDIVPGKFIFTVTGEKTFSLATFAKNEAEASQTFTLGDTIRFGEYPLCITKISDRSLKAYIGVPFLLVINDPDVLARSYANRLKVDWAEQGAGVMYLSLTGTNPDKEIDFLNGLVAAYQQLDLEKKNEAADRTIEFIQEQLGIIKDSLKTVEAQLGKFGNNGRVQDLSAESQRLLEKAELYESQKAELLVRRNYYAYTDQYLARQDALLDQIILPSSMGIADQVLNSMISKMVDLQLEMKMYTDTERVTNPLVVSKMQRIEALKKDVSEAINTLRSTDGIKLDFLNRQLSVLEAQVANLPLTERQLIAIQRNYSLLENLYVFLMQKLSEAGISKASNTSDVIPVDPPLRGGAISPKPLQNYSIALLFGILIPFAIFVLFELINNKVQSKEDIDKMTSIPFVGGVGHNTFSSNLIVRDKPKSGVAESFRALRSNLNYFTGSKTGQIFMVSSSISGEGKTFTTINLATVFALSRKRTLIVGADMRRPKIFEDFKRNNNLGLSTYLSGMSTFNEIVQDTEIENLYFVSGGPVPPNPSELLLTDRFEMFVKSALETFDYIIIDTPPLALVTDAFVISKFVDHTVFVLRQNYSPKEFIRSIDEYYVSGKIKNISILLNDIYKSGLGYGYGQGYAYHYGYGYGYGYGSRKNGNGYYEE
ncbi:MAG: GumC family protein [Bacteroidota bacterium]